MAAEIAVPVKIAPADAPSIPPKYAGLTASIYAIARNVVIPAIISVFTFVPFSFSLNSFSNIILYLLFIIIYLKKYISIFKSCQSFSVFRKSKKIDKGIFLSYN